MSLGRAQIFKVFLGDFFAPAKKLPALMRGSSALNDQKQKSKSLDSRVRGNDEQRRERKSKITGFPPTRE
jgi:hypothetical protein